uniref:Myb like protein n=1 Tax=Arabidopsis thaliana TaxID=3702 RepID=Q8GY43_ARATH|nr:myb like protein [Arabidopsis thaliana]
MIEKKLSKMKMRTKSIPVRSSRKSLDSLLDDEANENTQCDERDVPHKKRRCLGTSETTDRGGSVEPLLDLDACIVCEVSDERVSRCCGVDCLLSFHGECLYADLGSTSSSSSSSSEDVSNPFCPYCWLKIVALKSKTLREKTVEAEKAVCKYLDKEMKSRDEGITLSGDEIGNQEQSTDIVSDHELQGEKDGCSSKPDADQGKVGTGKVIDEVGASEKVATEKFQDAEDDETAKDQGTRILNTGAGKKREVSSFLSMQESFSAKEQDQVQQNEKRRRRGLKIIDSDISSKGSSNERNGEDVTEQVTSSVQVTSPSGRMRNQQATTKVVAKSKTVRDISFFKMDQRRRLLWTYEEEEMLKVGVEKFAAEANKNMPWRKILEMGEKVFHETRTPADLKDKWRSMVKIMNKNEQGSTLTPTAM